MPFDHTVHHTVRTREGSEPGRVTPYIILIGEGSQVILQNGLFLRSDGVPFESDEDVPTWAWNQALDLTNEARESVGLDALPVKEKVPQRGAAVDFMASTKGNPPMQLNAGDAETDGKASPVPQGDSFPEGQPAKDAASPKAVAKGPTPPIVKK